MEDNHMESRVHSDGEDNFLLFLILLQMYLFLPQTSS